MVRIVDANGCKDSATIILLGNSLPIDLISFSGEALYNHNLLQWVTATETNNDYFTLEKSLNGTHFEFIGTVDGAGNSTTIKQYLYKDIKPDVGISYYRLKQTDFDGSFAYSDIIALQRNNKSGIGYTYNGTDQQLIVFCNECTDENTQIEITDALGRLIHKSEFNGNRSTIIAEHFAKGYYFIKISSLKNVLTSKVLIY